MDIGRRLKNARDAIGYTLEKAEKESGIGASSLSEFENGKREPKFSQISRLAEVYKRSIDFFLTDKLPAEPVMLWRDGPGSQEEKKETEAEFRRLCQQYHKLEVLMGEVKRPRFHEPDISKAEEFSFQRAASFAGELRNQLCLGDIPSMSLRQVLEERFYVKIFHFGFSGSAISTVSEEFGLAVLLNKSSKLWRRNYDLGHELFHLLTWHIFRKVSSGKAEPTELEEKLANAFASRLLLPADSVRERVDTAMGAKGKISFEQIDEIAREFGVSLDALLWRMVYIYNMPAEEIQRYIERAKSVEVLRRPARRSDIPDDLPERYCSLAIRALREGKLSLMQFAKYTGISYKNAQEYLTDEEGFTDEEISISIA